MPVQPRIVVVSKRTRKTLRPELALAPGPLVLAQPGNGSLTALYGAAWAVALYQDGPQLLQVQAGVWMARDGGAALEGLSDAQHVSLAFDQAARPVLAWQEGSNIYVRQWSSQLTQYVTRGPWAGCDPVLICDAGAHYNPADSDVLLMHLDTARSEIVSRVQRELYAVSRRVSLVPAGAVLDQAVSLPYQVQLLAVDVMDVPLSVLVGLYPVRGEEAMTGAASGPNGGAVVELNGSQSLGLLGMDAQASGPNSGVLVDVILTHAAQQEMTAQASGPMGGEYGGVYVYQSLGLLGMTTQASGPNGGLLYAAINLQTLPTEAFTGAATGPLGGTYA